MPEKRTPPVRELPCVRYKRILQALAHDIDYDCDRAAEAVTRRLQAPDADGPDGLAALVARETIGAARYGSYVLDVDAAPAEGRPRDAHDTDDDATREHAAWYGLYLDVLHVCCNTALFRRAGL